jgi:hypothetical protein
MESNGLKMPSVVSETMKIGGEHLTLGKWEPILFDDSIVLSSNDRLERPNSGIIKRKNSAVINWIFDQVTTDQLKARENQFIRSDGTLSGDQDNIFKPVTNFIPKIDVSFAVVGSSITKNQILNIDHNCMKHAKNMLLQR